MLPGGVLVTISGGGGCYDGFFVSVGFFSPERSKGEEGSFLSSIRTRGASYSYGYGYGLRKRTMGLESVDRDALLHTLNHGSLDRRIEAAGEIRALSKTSNKSRTLLASAGVIPPLLAMLNSTAKDATHAALLALLNLAVRNESNKVVIVKEGAVSRVVELLGSTEEDWLGVRESAVALILTLSASTANKAIIGSSGAIPFLADLLVTGSPQAKADTITALYNIIICGSVAPKLTPNLVPNLVSLLKGCKKSSKVAEKAAALLEWAAGREEGQHAIAKEEGGILVLVTVLEEGSVHSRENAVGALLRMCESSGGCQNYRESILAEGVIPGLLELTVQGTTSGQSKARTLLQLLREPKSKSKSKHRSALMLENMVANIAAYVDSHPEIGTHQTAKQMLTEMVEKSMDHHQTKLPL